MSVIAFSLYALDGEKQRVGEARGIISLQWQEVYCGIGEAKLVCAATQTNRDALQIGNYIYNSDRPHLLAVIRSVEIDDSAADAKMTVRARMTASRLDDRVVMWTETYTDAERGALDIVSHNLRGLPVTVASPQGLSAPLEGQISWGSVSDAVTALTSACGLGWRITVDGAMSETFFVYRGADRTAPGSDAYVGFFGDKAGNIASIRLTNDNSETKNVAIVCGGGEGADRTVVEVDMSGCGYRRELYVDAKDLQKKVKVENPDGTTTEKTLTDEEYKAQLRGRGLEKLAETAGGLSVKAGLSQRTMLFGVDYDLGDILPIRVGKYGIAVNARVTAVNIIYEKSKTIDATLEVVK